MENTHCPKCKSEKWMIDMGLWASVDGIKPSVLIREPKDNSFHVIRDVVTAELKASVCGDCGYTELQAQNHKALWAGWGKGYR